MVPTLKVQNHESMEHLYPRVGWNKNNPFETSKVSADMSHNFENFTIFVFSFSHFYLIWEVCLVSAITFDVSNGLFLFHLPPGKSKKVFRSFIALLQLDIWNCHITWFLKISKISIFFAQNSKKGKKTGFVCPPPTLLLWSGTSFWYFVALKYHMWTTKKCVVRQWGIQRYLPFLGCT